MAIQDIEKSDAKKKRGFKYFIYGILIFLILILIKAYGGDTNDTYTPQVSQEQAQIDESEYGTSLAECNEKADEWFADAKKTTLEVIVGEEKRGLYANYDKQKEIDRITSSLYEELSDYKKECHDKFK